MIINPIPIIQPDDDGKKLMSFYKAIEAAFGGAQIHKLEWQDMRFYGLFVDGILKLHKPDDRLYNWIISESDLLGEDYITL